MDPQTLDALRWQTVVSKERSTEQPFLYAVVTTGVFCRPGCPSRQPNRENVRFFDSCKQAMQAGYRPCKRCQPIDDGQPEWTLVIDICRWIEANPTESDLASLARTTGYTSTYLHKRFRDATGITPFQYAKALRQQTSYRELADQPTVTQAMQQAGYRSSSQFYDEFRQFSSLPPGSHRQYGKDEVLTFAVAQTSLGALVVAASAKGLCWIALGDDPQTLVEELQRHFSRASFCPPDEAFNHWVSKVIGLVEQPGRSLELPLDIRGTVFQQQVWEALRKIPPGTTLDYQGLAELLGKPGGARAVAGACAANVLAVTIPCHRIVRRDGSLSGYRWGVDRKAALLRREQPSSGDQS